MTTDPLALAREVKERYEAAGAAKWFRGGTVREGYDVYHVIDSDSKFGCSVPTEQAAEFIIFAHNSTPALCDAIEQQAAEIERLTAENVATEAEIECRAMQAEQQAARIAELETAIAEIDRTLRVPAAEYVPAIQDVFKLIDALKGAAK